jgi:hypothetical protein
VDTRLLAGHDGHGAGDRETLIPGGARKRKGRGNCPGLSIGAANWLPQRSHTQAEYMLGWTSHARGCGGAGGGIRTHKGFRPEVCETSAYTSSATPAPFPAANPGNPEGQDARPHTCRRPRSHSRASRRRGSILRLRAGAARARSPRGRRSRWSSWRCSAKSMQRGRGLRAVAGECQI